MTTVDATRLAGEAYRTRIARGEAVTPDDKTRIAQEGYQSRLARDATGGQPDTSEFYKLGDKIGDRYEVSAIHHGELGVVYGCFDRQTKLPRALKTVRARHASDKQVLSLFESEAAIWISLEKHPYIVRAYLVERFKNVPYVITEYVRGPEGMEGDLRGWLGHARMTLSVAVAMALQIAQGMQHAVRKVPNLVHRDLKPANILVNGDGKAMVTDFGLVHAAQSSAGTPAYMSPEQWRAEALDARSDIYAYGCILFEMFTAHRLFPAFTESDWETAHLARSPAALTSIVPKLPGEIDRFVRRCLAKDPAARSQNWDEIVAFFAEWYHRLTGKAVVLDFSSLALDAAEWVSASYSLSNLKRYEEMLLACDRALAIDQNYADAWKNKGAALGHLNRYEEAIQACDLALVIDQNYVAAWYNKAIALGLLERYEEAIQAYDRALVIDQNYAEAWKNKGAALGHLNRYEEAIQAYDRALAVDPNYARGWFDRGFALHSLKRHEEALAAFDRALALYPNTIYPWDAKGLVLQLTTLSEGATVKGIVENITDYGAFVYLGGIDGLLHITDLAWRRLKHPSEVLNVGDMVTAKVLKVDTEKNRVLLGLKQLDEDPWVGISRRYPQGTRLFGAVTTLSDYGAFVEVEPGVEGLVLVSEMDWTNNNVPPSKVVQVGDKVEVMILEIDEDRRRILLGMKQCMATPWEEFSMNFKKGDKVKGQIKSITEFGVFIGLQGNIDGLVYLSDLSWSVPGEEAVRKYKKGDETEAVVLAIDVERERISLGIKQLDGDPFTSYVSAHDKNSIINGTVKSIDAKGAVIALEGDIEGYLRSSEVARDRVEDIRMHLKEGDAVTAMIINIDRKNRAINLSIKAKDMVEESLSACDRALAINPSFAIVQDTKSAALRELKHREAALSVRRPQSFWARFWGK